jgi:hypothetical protein
MMISGRIGEGVKCMVSAPIPSSWSVGVLEYWSYGFKGIETKAKRPFRFHPSHYSIIPTSPY